MTARSLSRFLLAALLCVAPAAFAQAGGGSAQLSYDALMRAPEGSWAEYTTSIKTGAQVQKIVMRFALVEKSASLLAIEAGGKTPMGVILTRMEYVPAGGGAWKLGRARMQMGAQPATDIPVPANTPLVKKGQALGTVVGTASVKTAAGTFKCREYQKPVDQGPVHMVFNLWMNDSVAPMGMVKQSDSDGRISMELTATGTGAKPQLK
jgi:hypothetical protein